MIHTDHQFSAIFAGSLLTLILLVCLHLFLWPYQKVLHRLHSYVVGIASIGAGITLTALLLNQWIVAIAFWAIVGPGGFAVAIAYWIRGVEDGRKKYREAAARILRRSEERLNHAVQGKPDDHRN